MIEICENLKNCFELSKTVKGTRKSCHFNPLSGSKIGHKLTSEDKNFVKILDFKSKHVEKFNHESFKCLPYVTCIYDWF